MELANELVSMRRRIMKRRIMEPQQGQNGGGGGEVRRVHIIYFLSRKGRIEHPHLIRVHHLSRNGVRLRDVKRWLSELRGKDMPDSFAWSYKRRYKAGYVWQDLLDEDLITPISDNEYVLKGSEIASTIFGNDLHTYGEKKMSTDDQEHPHLENIEIESKDQKVSSKEAIDQEHPQTKIDVMAKTSSEIEEESPPFSSDTLTTLTEDSTKLEEKKPLDTSKQGIKGQSDKFENNSIDYFYSNHLNNNNTNNNNNKSKNKTNSGTTSSSSTSSRSSFTRSKSYSSGASNMLRSLITCGNVDTNDSAVVMINRRDKSGALNGCTKGMDSCTAELSKGEKLGGSERMFGTTLNQQYQDNGARKSYDGAKGTKKKKNKSEFSNQKPLSAAYKPVNGPNCSQCGKMFKPEKLHTHMKSCRGMKTLAKGASPAASMKAQSHSSSMDDSSFQQSASGYYLTHN